MSHKYSVNESVYCIMNTNIPSSSDIFGRWVILFGEITNLVKTDREVPAYEVRLKTELQRKFYNRTYILLYEDRVFKTIEELRFRLLKELDDAFEKEKDAIEDYITEIKKEGIRRLLGK